MIAIKYAIFAIISTLFNLSFQKLSFHFYDYNNDFSLYIAMFFGTLAGLLSKYILDKKFIFYHTPMNKKDDTKKFILYSFMGVFTTFIFLGFEIAFDLIFATPSAKYIGAIIGLSIGYLIKYYLDKTFVFK